MEIEYKFLVNPVLLPSLSNGYDIIQGYLSTKPVVRVRIYDNKYGFLTIKGPGLSSREEFEYKIPLEDANSMLNLCDKVLTKTRYIIPIEDSQLKWEIDFFKGKNNGLVMAELEVPYIGFEFEKPIWLGEDVSENPNYTNVSLAIEV